MLPQKNKKYELNKMYVLNSCPMRDIKSTKMYIFESHPRQMTMNLYSIIRNIDNL